MIGHAAALIPLFVYAELESVKDPNAQPACAHGILRQRDDDGAAQFGPTKSLVYGEVRYVTLPELHDIDSIEAPEYQRVTIMVYTDREVFSAYAYAYIMPDFNTLPLVPDGRFKGPEYGDPL